MIGVIILNYNDWNNAINCINSIDEKIQLRIYFVDNNSVKNSEIEKKIQDKAVLIKNDKNTGYAEGNNIGIRMAIKDNCEAIVICNTDIILKENVIGSLYDSMIENNADWIGPKIKTKNGEQEVILGTNVDKYKKIILTLRKTPLKIFFLKYYKDFSIKRNSNKIVKTYGMSGCFFMINKTAYQTLYPLDTNTFLYNEEYIIAEKMKCSKRKGIIDRGIEVMHIGGESTKKLAAESFKYFIQSEEYVLRKYYKAGMFIMTYFKILRKVQYWNRNK
jgi:GT2 family glycosyltransferase